MPPLKRWIDRARKLAEETLPDEVLEAGRKLGKEVLRHTPSPIADAVARYVPGDENDDDDASAEPDAGDAAAPAESGERTHDDRADVLRRVHEKAEHGLKPEDRLVVIYATANEAESVAEIRSNLSGVQTTIREMDLAREPQTAKQIAQLTGIMVPPYVFINGRYWGGQYEICALEATGDLENVVANRIDVLGEEARRIGNLHESFSDDVSVPNILHRWRLGHILCVDDLDSWFEVDRDGHEHFYFQGGPRPVADMERIAHEIVGGVESDAFEARWLLDPSIALN